jgi:plasmid stabilization system protein ParE
MAYSVVFTPEARAQLIALYRHIEIHASPAIAQRFTDAIVNHCERFRELPARAVRRDDIRPGLTSRTIAGAWSLLLRLKVRRCGSLVCFTPAKTTNRFYKLTLDYPKRN